MKKLVEWFTVDTKKVQCEIGQAFFKVTKLPKLNLTPGKFMSAEKVHEEAMPIYHFVDFNGKDRYVAVDLETLQFLEPAYKDYFGGKVKQLEKDYNELERKLYHEASVLMSSRSNYQELSDRHREVLNRMYDFNRKNVFQRIISAIKGEI